jgi:hypothetical protein
MHKILIIGYVWPEPNSSAAGSRMLQLIKFFRAQNWSLTFASPAVISEHRIDLEAYGVDQVEIKLNHASFDEFISQLAPTIVLFDRFMMEEQFGWRVEQTCPNALRILDTEDLHCLRQARHQALKNQRDVSTQDLNSDLAIREVSAILRCDLTLMISQVEIKLLENHFSVPSELLLHLPFMLPTVNQAHFKPYAQRTGYMTIGNFRHAPNWDAVLYLKNTIWPLIRALEPTAQLDIYGAYPPPKATQLHNPRQGFYIKGWAKDAQQVMQTARICLAPLRFGAGLKGKLIEAMQYGTPSITTSIGAESMNESLPWNGVITDEPAHFAQAAVDLYHNQDDWQQASENGATIINHLYQNQPLSKRLLIKIDYLVQNLANHRLNNFTGMMLRHHSMKSTRYMAQWIEAKNKLNH